jgi:hypothetical protein
MNLSPRDRGCHSLPPAVLALLVFESILTTVLLLLGVAWLSLLAYAGPAIAFTLALLNPMVQELGRRQPKLSVTTKEGGLVLTPSAARPWPVDAQRVLANELDEARETTKRRHSVLDDFMNVGGPFVVRPSEADHQRAQEEFEKEVERFEAELRDWLTEYAGAARAYADTFDIAILLRNAASGAHAEAVTVVLDLPESVVVVEDRPDRPPPPDRPVYQPPRSRSVSPTMPFSHVPRLADDLARAIVQPAGIAWRDPTWKVGEGGRHLEAAAGDIHPDRRVSVGEPLLFRAYGSGRHAISWTVYTKSARKAASGTITLEVPPDSPRPAFGRLHGITSYPDVPFVDADGEIVKEVRDSDPPDKPPPKGEGTGAFEVLQEASAFWEWRALGLDPADDGPDRSTVSRAEPVIED